MIEDYGPGWTGCKDLMKKIVPLAVCIHLTFLNSMFCVFVCNCTSVILERRVYVLSPKSFAGMLFRLLESVAER